jgi:RNA polymerase sigma-70 factor (ECF subfamily)
MDRYADGDDAAFAEIYDLLGPRLYAFFLRNTRDPGQAEDLMQHTLLNIHVARASFARGSDMVPWALAIGRRLMIDARRKTKRETLFESAEDEAAAIDERAERFDIPDDLLISRELAAKAENTLAIMPAAHRAAFLLVREDGLSIAEAAKVAATTPTTIKLRAHRAYQAIRCALDALVSR